MTDRFSSPAADDSKVPPERSPAAADREVETPQARDRADLESDVADQLKALMFGRLAADPPAETEKPNDFDAIDGSSSDSGGNGSAASVEETTADPAIAGEDLDFEDLGFESFASDSPDSDSLAIDLDLESSSLDASGLDTSGLDASSLDASGLDALGLDTSSLDASGLDALGLDTSSLDASSLDSLGLDFDDPDPDPLDPVDPEKSNSGNLPAEARSKARSEALNLEALDFEALESENFSSSSPSPVSSTRIPGSDAESNPELPPERTDRDRPEPEEFDPEALGFRGFESDRAPENGNSGGSDGGESSLEESSLENPSLDNPSLDNPDRPDNREPEPAEGDGNPLAQLQQLLVGDEMQSLDRRLADLHDHLDRVQGELADPDALVSRLAPIIDRLIARKVEDSQDDLCEAMLPLIDRLIYQRSLQDREAMSHALAATIPPAISQRIREAPQEIAQAIAPEMAAALREQIRLDREAISEALATEMGRTIKRQIEVERDAMIDALYPVIGQTIAKYFREAIQEINEKISKTLSAEGMGRKIRARLQGVSEAELIFKEALPFTVQAAFLIQKQSGLIIAEAQKTGSDRLESEMLAGMLTAMRSFASDCIVGPGQTSELTQIEYEGSSIFLEVAGYCYLAAIVSGAEPPRAFVRQMRRTLETFIANHDRPIQNYDGDPRTVPEEIPKALQTLLEKDRGSKARASAGASEAEAALAAAGETPGAPASGDGGTLRKPRVTTQRRRGIPWFFWGAVALALLAIALPPAAIAYRRHINRRFETAAREALNRQAALSVYAIEPEVERGKLVLRGRVPDLVLRELAGTTVARATDSLPGDRPVENDLVVVRLPPQPSGVAETVRKTAALLSRETGVDLVARYEFDGGDPADPQGTVAIEGLVRSQAERDAVSRAFLAIPGVRTVQNDARPVLPVPDTCLYFDVSSPTPVPVDLRGKVAPVRRWLDLYPDLHLRIVGHSPPGEPDGSEALALQRAQAVRADFIDQGVDPDRLTAEGRAAFPPGMAPGDPDWKGRCVRFEALAAPAQSPAQAAAQSETPAAP